MTVSTVVDLARQRIRKLSRTWCTWRYSNLRAWRALPSPSFPPASSSRGHPYPFSFFLFYWGCRQASGGPPSVHVAATLFESICYSNKDALSAGIIVAGWDKEVGPSVYNIPLGGGLFRQPWAIGGSGSTYVYGYCDATYKEGWGRGETVEFVKNSGYPSLFLHS
jgi:Proteasome subunit